MSFEFHKNKQLYFSFQYENAMRFVLHFLQDKENLQTGVKFLEVGCAKAGMLKDFTEIGCICTGISIERFESICNIENYAIIKMKFYIINPIYEYKFGLKVCEQLPIISAFPWIRNFFTTAVYYLIEKK